jgi:hypothetical protein
MPIAVVAYGRNSIDLLGIFIDPVNIRSLSRVGFVRREKVKMFGVNTREMT